jgi:hypothetical protein
LIRINSNPGPLAVLCHQADLYSITVVFKTGVSRGEP